MGVAFDGGDEGHGVAVADDDGAVGLFGEFAGFEDEGLRTEGTFDTTCLHGMILLWQAQCAPAGRSRHRAEGSMAEACSDEPAAQLGSVSSVQRSRAGQRVYLRRPSRPMTAR